MQIRSEDLDAIVTAVEMLIEGTLSTVHVCRDGEVIFSAHNDGSELVIDPDVMAPELARHLLEHTALGGSPQPAPSEPGSRSGGADPSQPPETATAKRGDDRPVRA